MLNLVGELDGVILYIPLVVLVLPPALVFFQLIYSQFLLPLELLVRDVGAARRQTSVEVGLDDAVVAVTSGDSVDLILVVWRYIVIDDLSLGSVPEVIGRMTTVHSPCHRLLLRNELLFLPLFLV